MEIQNSVNVTSTMPAKVTASVVVLKATTEIKMKVPWKTMDEHFCTDAHFINSVNCSTSWTTLNKTHIQTKYFHLHFIHTLLTMVLENNTCATEKIKMNTFLQQQSISTDSLEHSRIHIISWCLTECQFEP